MTEDRTRAGNRGASAEIGPASAGAPGAAVRGTVRIAPAVLIELIELTVRDVPGVIGDQPRRRIERILPRATGASTRPTRPGTTFEDRGVRVTVDGDRIHADVSVVVDGQANIMTLGQAIQREVGSAVGRMLGMSVGDVNVFVANFEDLSAER